MFADIIGSALAPAVSNIATDAVAPVATDMALEAINPALNTLAKSALQTGVVDGALTGTQGIFDALGSGIGKLGQTTAQGVGDGMFDSIGNFTKAITSDQAQNGFKILGQGYDIYNKGKQLDNAQNIQNQQLAMQQDVYARDKSADQRRQKLVF